jgi:nucleoside-diphosphate-sugar epimerase
MKRILVTGVAGLLGQVLCRKLRANGSIKFAQNQY